DHAPRMPSARLPRQLDDDIRVGQRVAIPVGARAVAGDEIHRVVIDAEPDLDLGWGAGASPGGHHTAALDIAMIGGPGPGVVLVPRPPPRRSRRGSAAC